MNRKCQRGWSLNWLSIFLCIIATLIYLYGWMVLLWVIILAAGITIATMIHDKIRGAPEISEMPAPRQRESASEGNERRQACERCGALDFGAFVQYGSFFTKCLNCGHSPWATSFIAVSPQMGDRYRAVIVDEKLNEKQVVAEGIGSDMADKIEEAAQSGALVWLKPVI